MANHDDARRSHDYSTIADGYETGESSTAASLRDVLPPALPYQNGRATLSSTPSDTQAGNVSALREDRARRKQRHRTTSAFLLHDAVPREPASSGRRHTQEPPSHKSKALAPPSGLPPAIDHRAGPRGDPTKDPRRTPPRHSAATSSRGTSDRDSVGTLERSPTQQRSPDGLDIDSNQIVHMALNLSESRRIASRKATLRANPPSLAPVPDASVGGNLKHHFQQQRRTSRNISPRPNHAGSPRIPPSNRVHSPLQPAFDPANDGRYRYQFSTSTLARAQKAREHLELMAEYRRCLELLPPLKPGFDHSVLATPPGSPSPSLLKPGASPGRPYNPLQYIRNRKVRGRERKVIDGERQGFGDIETVRTWVDELSLQTKSQASSLDAAAFTMPAFPGAEEADGPHPPEAAVRNPNRVRRPRVDWFVEPCDLVADAYWLEQDHHKQLIEDRNWRKIFPSQPAVAKAPQVPAEETITAATSLQQPPTEHPAVSPDLKEPTLSKADTSLSQSSAKERAKQKLQDIKGFHHRHTSSAHNHDFLRMRRDSLSDLSDSGTETKPRVRHSRSGTITSNAKDILEKQMLELIAKEAQENQLASVQEADAEHQVSVSSSVTPERNAHPELHSQYHSRKGSLADTSDSDHRPLFDRSRWRSRHGTPGRRSLDVPDTRRGSVDIDSSLPASPDLGANRDGRLRGIPALGLDYSPPSSRSPSPTRNPLAKVKQIWRDKSREAGLHSHEDGKDGKEQDHNHRDELADPVASPEHPRPSEALSPVSDGRAAHKLHRRSHSMLPRVEDTSGLRGIFKGPRIDNVIRGGVSKLGDILWKKDGTGDHHHDSEITDESDGETALGRERSSTLSHLDSNKLRDTPQHSHMNFLDTMPEFRHAVDTRHRMNLGSRDYAGQAIPSSRPVSRQSARFELLKPPRIDIGRATSSAASSVTGMSPIGGSDASDAERNHVGDVDKTKSGSGGFGLVVPGQQADEEMSLSRSRHWSITDQSPAQPTQISRREVARMRALILTSGIKAMEIARRAHEVHEPFKEASATETTMAHTCGADIPWADVARLSPDISRFYDQKTAACESYALAAQVLGVAVQTSGQRWHQAVDHFTARTSVDLQQRIWAVRSRIDDLSNMSRRAADEADETSKDLALGQPLKVKHVVDTIERMLRQRRRRFRWVRRALWLTVEWALVGFMWYVWFVVTILRVVWGVGTGVWSGIRWLFWF
ncbi:hypothetical protein S40293_03885 [Stachybotrys chartarum IBT 40293]|nr:hypothetical protein S40293_03885 [Stachybotrys chartarum IBT 40293]